MDLERSTAVSCFDLKERLIVLEKLLADPLSECYIERLLDVVIAAVNDSPFIIKAKENDQVASFLKRFTSVAATLRSFGRQPQDFSPIASLGHGAFGRVQLVREVATGRVCAMKVLKKSRMLTQHTDYWAEREIMARGESPWIVKLFYAFQDVTSLYMVMEYVPGGTLVGWMEDVEVISEAACRFYAAETVLALADLHAMGFIHRDLKPDNLLLDIGGHLKLADFGTAIRVDPNTLLIHCDAAVGTPDYLSPEVLLSQGAGGGSYGFEVDWWALGVLVYEMLYGDTPFYSETLVNTYAKIMSHDVSLKFPESFHVSDSAVDFMKQLLRSRECRLGFGADGAIAVQNHPWFSPDWADSVRAMFGPFDGTDSSLADWTWSNIRACRAPFQPNLASEIDTSYFQLDTEDEAQVRLTAEDPISIPARRLSDPAHDGLTESKAKSARSPETESFLSSHPGSQLAFAGFSFSSSRANNLALLNGLYLAPPTLDSTGIADVNSTTARNDKSLANNQSPSVTPPPLSNESHSHRSSSPSVNGNITNGPDRSTENRASQTQPVADESKREDVAALAELTDRLNKTVLENRSLENKLKEREAAHREAIEQSEQRLERIRTEAADDLARLEAEVAKWKSVAQSEQAARQLAEVAATDRLAKQAAEVVDRVAGVGSRNKLSSTMSAASSFIQDNHLPNGSDDVSSKEPYLVDEQVQGDTNSFDLAEKQTVPVKGLLLRIEEMARRAHLAETSARESADALETAQRFWKLYENSFAEKCDQLKEMKCQMEELHEHLKSTEQAARRALDEEKEQSAHYREVARKAEADARAASQRAALSQERLEQMAQACAKDKMNLTATVNKLIRVMSGENADALYSMWSTQNAEYAARSGAFTNTNAVGRNKSGGFRNITQRSRMGHREKDVKRLVDEINRLRNEITLLKRVANHSEQMEEDLVEVETKNSEPDEELCQEPSHVRQNSEIPSNVEKSHLSFVHSRNRFDQFDLRQSKSFGARGRESGRNSLRASPAHMFNSFASPLGYPTPQDLLMRRNSFGEKYIHTVHGPSSSASRMDILPSPMRVPTDNIMNGILELGIRQRGRKRLAWDRRIARLTLTHLILSQCSSDGTASGPTRSPTGTATPTLSRHQRVQAVTSIVEIPLTAMLHVRSINPCDLYHHPSQDVPRIFHLIYDRTKSGDAMLNAAATNLDHSTTLPRKLSSGSSSVFAVQGSHQSVNRHLVRADSMSSTNTNSTCRSVRNYPARLDGSTTPIANVSTVQGSSPVPLSVPRTLSTLSDSNWPLPISGHTFQHIVFRTPTSCDICHQPCWHFISPPDMLQCTHCQFKLHTSHVELQECNVPTCEKAALSYFFRCPSENEKQQWVHHLSLAIKQVRNFSSTTSGPSQIPVSQGFGSRVPVSTKTLPSAMVSGDRTATPSPDRDVLSSRLNRMTDDSPNSPTTNNLLFVDTKDERVEKHETSTPQLGEPHRTLSPDSTVSNSGSLVSVPAERSTESASESIIEKVDDTQGVAQ